MAGVGWGPVPVWLAEEDLGCVICQELLKGPTTLPCGHSFCRDCLRELWAKGRGAGARPSWCPTCRDDWPAPLALRKNPLLQELTDKYRRAGPPPAAPPAPVGTRPPHAARRPLLPAAHGPPRPRACPASSPPPLPASAHLLDAPSTASSEPVAQQSNSTVGLELTELVEQLIDISRNLQKEAQYLQPGPEDEPNPLDVQDTFETRGKKLQFYVHQLEEIQGKLQENFKRKETFEEQPVGKLPATPSSTSCPLPDQKNSAPKRASCFAQHAVHLTFDYKSLCDCLQVSEDGRTLMVSKYRMPYPRGPERFTVCQAFCSQAFTSGQQYWEVDTQHCSNWSVGVASRGMSRNETLGRTLDSWCVEWKGTNQLSGWCMQKQTVLGSDRPSVVGIWLDLEECKLAFYSVADQEKLLYECPISPLYTLHPAFWLYGLETEKFLTLRPVEM
ncbi:E3 ubiquitin-protein ligase RNF135 [Sorex fumeus]|uniref:E3 ubiquitin-protein ligase RNF135 n=1 Tax=Sorex fumeus TaxID=62283 RepID=UPI0024AD29DA|nr:E3 ubiquitin-protein ligase RNF135 [Sorex fumeus]